MFNEETINKEVDEFIRQLRVSGTHATTEELKEVLSDFSEIVKRYKDYGLAEIVKALLKEVTDEMLFLSHATDPDLRYALPGILVGFKTPMFDINISEGYTKDGGEPITRDTLFDLASISKLYTGVIAYKLIGEGILSFDQNIADLFKDSALKCRYLGDTTIRDIMQFRVKLQTADKDGNIVDKEGRPLNIRIDTAPSTEGAREILYNTKVVGREYHYNDMGMMILKEVIEKVTGKTFEELFNEYIIRPLMLQNTYLNVPEEKRHLITGTPNAQEGLPNDPKAIIMGGYSGHAGIFANNDDLLHFVRTLMINPKYFNPSHTKDLVTPFKDGANRGLFGSTYVSHKEGLDKSMVDKKYPLETFAVQGSTRTQAISGKFMLNRQSHPFATSILMNPSSLSLETILEKQIKFNKNYITDRSFIDVNGKERRIYSVAGQSIVPIGKLDDLNKKCASAVLKLTLLGIVAKEWEPNHIKETEFNIRASK